MGLCRACYARAVIVYLIDIDGTLLLSGGAGFAALEQAFVELHGVPHAMRTVRPAGKTDPLIIDEGFRATLARPPTPGEVDAVLERYLVHLPEAVRESQRFRVLRGARAGLDLLRAGGHVLAVGIARSWSGWPPGVLLTTCGGLFCPTKWWWWVTPRGMCVPRGTTASPVSRWHPVRWIAPPWRPAGRTVSSRVWTRSKKGKAAISRVQ